MASGNPVLGLKSFKNSIEVIEYPKAHGVTGFVGGIADMRHQESIGELPVFRVDIGFVVENIEPCTIEFARFKSGNQGSL